MNYVRELIVQYKHKKAITQIRGPEDTMKDYCVPFKEYLQITRQLTKAGFKAKDYIDDHGRLYYDSSIAEACPIEDFILLSKLGYVDCESFMAKDDSYKPRYLYPYFT